MIHLILGVYAHVIPCFMFLWLLIMTSCILCAFYIFIFLSCIHRCTQGSDSVGVRATGVGKSTRGATSRSWGGGGLAEVSRPSPIHLRRRQAPEHYKPPTIFLSCSAINWLWLYIVALSVRRWYDTLAAYDYLVHLIPHLSRSRIELMLSHA